MIRRELLVFEIAAQKFALPLSLVEEVVPVGSYTAVPQSPPYLLGLTAVRGKVMGVIDAACRYGIGPALSAHFLVCKVRGNLTAVTIDRAVTAGALTVRDLEAGDVELLRSQSGLGQEFVAGGFELFEETEEGAKATGTFVLEVKADHFVSTEMALRTGEA